MASTGRRHQVICARTNSGGITWPFPPNPASRSAGVSSVSASLPAEALIPAARRSERAVIAACASRELAKAQEFASRHDIPRVYESAAALVARRRDRRGLCRDPQCRARADRAGGGGGEKACFLRKAAGARHHLGPCRGAGLPGGRGGVCALGLHLRLEKSLHRVAEILRGGTIGTVRALSIERSAPLDERVPVARGPGPGRQHPLRCRRAPARPGAAPRRGRDRDGRRRSPRRRRIRARAPTR